MVKISQVALVDHVENAIYLIRGKKVLLDSDMAGFYGVTTKRLNEQVKRNCRRFPADFMFQLTSEEHLNLMSQNATSSLDCGRRRKLPSVFTGHGAIMAASILNSQRAIEMSVFVVRAFIRFREMLSFHKELAGKLEFLEKRLSKHDTQIHSLFQVIRDMIKPPLLGEPKRKRIGFLSD